MSDELAQREMTLKEWMARLPDTHTANVELAALRELYTAERAANTANITELHRASADMTALREPRCETCQKWDECGEDGQGMCELFGVHVRWSWS